MNSNSLVSIVLPTYNGSRYLEKAVRSCLDQTHSDWELVIVDDASTDATADLLEEIAGWDPRIRTTRHETNRKLPAALNTGFALTKGEFVSWTSDDNRYRKNAISTMFEFLKSNPETDIVYSDYTMINEKDDPIRRITVGNPDTLGYGNSIGSCFLYRRHVHDELNGYDENLFMAEDYDFWLRAAEKFRMTPLRRDLYLYRVHELSLTGKKWPDLLDATEKALKKNLPQMRRNDKAIVDGYVYLMKRAWARGERVSAWKYLMRTIFASPGAFLRKVVFAARRRIQPTR